MKFKCGKCGEIVEAPEAKHFIHVHKATEHELPDGSILNEVDVGIALPLATEQTDD